MRLSWCARLWNFTYFISVYGGLLPTVGWNTFSYPLPYNGSSRTIFAAGSTINISWVPGGRGPSGPITILLLGGVLNTTIPPEIASGIDNSLASYAWKIPTILPQYAYYDLEILLDANPSYYSQAVSQFVISGLNPTDTSSSISSTSTTQANTQASDSTFLSTSTTTSSPAPTHAQNTSTSLSKGAKVGISIGAVVGGILLVVIGIVLFKQGKRIGAKESSTSENAAGKAGASNPEEQEAPLTTKERAELEAMRRAAELQGSSVVQELSGGEREELEARRRQAHAAEME